MVKISILPVMGGLALCSANEAKFNFDGFVSSDLLLLNIKLLYIIANHLLTEVFYLLYKDFCHRY